METGVVNQGRMAEVYDIGNRRIVKLFGEGFPEAAIENKLRIAEKINDSSVPMIPKKKNGYY